MDARLLIGVKPRVDLPQYLSIELEEEHIECQIEPNVVDTNPKGKHWFCVG